MKHQGLGYIEALIVIAVVGFALVPMIHLFITSFRLNKAGYEYLQANLSAQEIISLLKSKKYTNIDFETSIDIKKLDYEFPKEFRNFNPTAYVSLKPYAENMVLVSVYIDWTEKNTKHRLVNNLLLSKISGRDLKTGDWW